MPKLPDIYEFVFNKVTVILNKTSLTVINMINMCSTSQKLFKMAHTQTLSLLRYFLLDLKKQGVILFTIKIVALYLTLFLQPFI